METTEEKAKRIAKTTQKVGWILTLLLTVPIVAGVIAGPTVAVIVFCLCLFAVIMGTRKKPAKEGG